MPSTCISVTVLLSMIACTAQVVFASSHQERNALEYELNDNVMRWAKSQGAFIHDAVEIRHIEGGLSGLFASKPIPEGQVLSLVPLNLTIFSDDMNGQEDDGDYAEYSYHEEMCILLHNVYASLAKNETIQNPYEKYLASRSHDHLPITWSVEAKEMLQQLDGPSHHYGFTKYTLNIKSQIRSWCEDFDESWGFDYESHMDDPKFLDAAYLAITRSESDIGKALVPFMDLVNHSNGYSWNVDANHVLNEKFEFVASRQIDEGEQLYYSYDRCSYCPSYDELKNGTPNLFSTYGFLEHYPQRWVFEGVDLAFDVNDNAGNLSASFVDPPTKTDILFLKKELKRLELFGRIKLRRRAQVLVDSVEDMSELELDSITKFHGALVKACKVALDAAQSLKRDVYTTMHRRCRNGARPFCSI